MLISIVYSLDQQDVLELSWFIICHVMHTYMNSVPFNYQGVPVVAAAGNEKQDACNLAPAKSKKVCVHYFCKAV